MLLLWATGIQAQGETENMPPNYSSEERGSTTSQARLAVEGPVFKHRSLCPGITWLPDVVYSITEGTLVTKGVSQGIFNDKTGANKMWSKIVSLNFRYREGYTMRFRLALNS